MVSILVSTQDAFMVKHLDVGVESLAGIHLCSVDRRLRHYRQPLHFACFDCILWRFRSRSSCLPPQRPDALHYKELIVHSGQPELSGYGVKTVVLAYSLYGFNGPVVFDGNRAQDLLMVIL